MTSGKGAVTGRDRALCCRHPVHPVGQHVAGLCSLSLGRAVSQQGGDQGAPRLPCSLDARDRKGTVCPPQQSPQVHQSQDSKTPALVTPLLALSCMC